MLYKKNAVSEREWLAPGAAVAVLPGLDRIHSISSLNGENAVLDDRSSVHLSKLVHVPEGLSGDGSRPDARLADMVDRFPEEFTIEIFIGECDRCGRRIRRGEITEADGHGLLCPECAGNDPAVSAAIRTVMTMRSHKRAFSPASLSSIIEDAADRAAEDYRLAKGHGMDFETASLVAEIGCVVTAMTGKPCVLSVMERLDLIRPWLTGPAKSWGK